jgi:hypothetical protein
MVQVLDKKKEYKRRFEVEFIPHKERKPKTVKAKPKKKHRALRKLINKAKYNPKYLEETYNLNQLKAKVHSKAHGLRQDFYT